MCLQKFSELQPGDRFVTSTLFEPGVVAHISHLFDGGGYLTLLEKIDDDTVRVCADNIRHSGFRVWRTMCAKVRM